MAVICGCSVVKSWKGLPGFTKNIKNRLAVHNEGKSVYTSKLKPWKIKNAIAFEEERKAVEFEKYVKSHSGRAFMKKHFLIINKTVAIYSQ